MVDVCHLRKFPWIQGKAKIITDDQETRDSGEPVSSGMMGIVTRTVAIGMCVLAAEGLVLNLHVHWGPRSPNKFDSVPCLPTAASPLL